MEAQKSTQASTWYCSINSIKRCYKLDSNASEIKLQTIGARVGKRKKLQQKTATTSKSKSSSSPDSTSWSRHRGRVGAVEGIVPKGEVGIGVVERIVAPLLLLLHRRPIVGETGDATRDQIGGMERVGLGALFLLTFPTVFILLIIHFFL